MSSTASVAKFVAAVVLAAAAAICVPDAPRTARASTPFEGQFFVNGAGRIDGETLGTRSVSFSWSVILTEGQFRIEVPRVGDLFGTYSAREDGACVLVPSGEQDDVLRRILEQLHRDADLEESSSSTGLGTPVVTESAFTFFPGSVRGRGKLTVSIVLAPSSADPSGTRLTAKGSVVEPQVYVLDDGFSAPQVLAAMKRIGVKAVEAGFYQSWPGFPTIPPSTHTVFVLQGYRYDDVLTAGGDAALVAFLDAGGLVVRNEWVGYEVGTSPKWEIDRALPVRSPTSAYGYGPSWRTRARHPLTAGLGNFQLPVQGCTVTVAEPGSTTLMTLTVPDVDEVPADGAPALVLSGDPDRAVLYVNNDLSYAERKIHPKILRIYQNAAKWSRRR